MKIEEKYRRCECCGEDYMLYALESFEVVVKGSERLCKDCLGVMVDEYYSDSEDEERTDE